MHILIQHTQPHLPQSKAPVCLLPTFQQHFVQTSTDLYVLRMYKYILIKKQFTLHSNQALSSQSQVLPSDLLYLENQVHTGASCIKYILVHPQHMVVHTSMYWYIPLCIDYLLVCSQYILVCTFLYQAHTRTCSVHIRTTSFMLVYTRYNLVHTML
jgi:hypothetical protein